MTKEIIIIGGQGFAGLTLLSHLNALYNKIHVITRRSNTPYNTDKIQYYCLHEIQGKVLDTLLKKCHAVIYLASNSTPGSSAKKPLIELQTNIQPALEFIDQLQQHPHIHLIYTSSGGAIYDTRYYLDQAITENHLISPPSYYGAGKIAIETFLMAYSHQLNHPVTLLRPSNFYGVGQPKKTGFGLIRTIFDKLINNQPVEIWGDGENKRDYIYIDDFALACIACLSNPPINSTQVFNVGSGFGYSINEICAKIESTTSTSITRQYQTARSVDIKNITLDYRQIHQKTSWVPTTTLDEGLNKMWTWLQTQK
jgi:UDP-glucose 4-epimerase